MYDFNARHIVEALRSGIPSRAVGQYFSEARPKVMKEISHKLDFVADEQKSCGMVVCGKYGEGKTVINELGKETFREDIPSLEE